MQNDDDVIDEYKHQIRMSWLGTRFHFVINELIDELLSEGYIIEYLLSGVSGSGNFPGPPLVGLCGYCSNEHYLYIFDARWLKDAANYSNPQDRWILDSIQMEII